MTALESLVWTASAAFYSAGIELMPISAGPISDARTGRNDILPPSAEFTGDLGSLISILQPYAHWPVSRTGGSANHDA